MVNAVNFLDLALHGWYIAVMCSSLKQHPMGMTSFASFLPVAIVALGLVAAYLLAHLLPAVLSKQHT